MLWVRFATAGVGTGPVMLLGYDLTVCLIAIGLSADLLWGRWAQAAVTGILIFLAFLWCVYALVRVAFFIPVVVVAENHIGIRRAWHLGKGNFWRILGIMLIVTLPLSMAVNTVTSSMLQMAMGPEFGGVAAATPAEGQKILMDLLHAVGRIWPYYAVLQLINLILQAGLLAGASANARKVGEGVVLSRSTVSLWVIRGWSATATRIG